MANNEVEVVNGIDVDVDKAQRLIKKVIVKEKRNLSTKEFGTTEMVRRLIQLYLQIPLAENMSSHLTHVRKLILMLL